MANIETISLQILDEKLSEIKIKIRERMEIKLNIDFDLLCDDVILDLSKTANDYSLIKNTIINVKINPKDQIKIYYQIDDKEAEEICVNKHIKVRELQTIIEEATKCDLKKHNKTFQNNKLEESSTLTETHIAENSIITFQNKSRDTLNNKTFVFFSLKTIGYPRAKYTDDEGKSSYILLKKPDSIVDVSNKVKLNWDLNFSDYDLMIGDEIINGSEPKTLDQLRVKELVVRQKEKVTIIINNLNDEILTLKVHSHAIVKDVKQDLETAVDLSSEDFDLELGSNILLDPMEIKNNWEVSVKIKKIVVDFLRNNRPFPNIIDFTYTVEDLKQAAAKSLDYKRSNIILKLGQKILRFDTWRISRYGIVNGSKIVVEMYPQTEAQSILVSKSTNDADHQQFLSLMSSNEDRVASRNIYSMMQIDNCPVPEQAGYEASVDQLDNQDLRKEIETLKWRIEKLTRAYERNGIYISDED